jgi:hypothetical protein
VIAILLSAEPLTMSKLVPLIAAIATSLALIFYFRQSVSQSRENVANVFRLVFERMDLPEMRKARDYIYNQMLPQVFQDEHWAQLGKYLAENKDKVDVEIAKDWSQHKQWVEMVARSFDQLGLLVREGVAPMNLVSQFYVMPATRCLCLLYPYIQECRKLREQDGHLWEWENLVANIIIPQTSKGKGIWKGVYDHDKLQPWCMGVQQQMKGKDVRRDDKYHPRARHWVIRPSYVFWRWGKPW